MPLGTLDRTPPPFFRQGPSALTKLTVFSALAVFLMVADTRMNLTQPLRALLATVLHPVQRTLLLPVQAWRVASDYVQGVQHARSGEDQARRALAQQSERAAQVETLMVENARLRELLELRPALGVKSQAAEIMYDGPDPYSRKVVIDRGAHHAVALGSPVINEAGVLGQVTRVYPLSSEVTLLTDKDAAIPLLNVRSQARSAAFGMGTGLELRFMAGNADVQVGDLMRTSGFDGIYPPGLQVAVVTAVDRKIDTGFAKIVLKPFAQPDSVRHVLVLEPMGLQLPPRPAAAPTSIDRPAAAKKGGRK